ncbi:AI-2E family transporter [Sphingomonas sp. 37zxx]|uniref:AI-2E family transporter n=1 Tax=Sphingomonas sp. 37zxx TaxID=1550073 RepID=UPI00068AD8D8|nr:AI-2E family transporter [Sphingomonas sp. 37zxx]
MGSSDQARVVRNTLIVLLLVGTAILLTQLSFVFLLIFAAILLATLIRSAALPFLRMGLPDTPATLLGLAAIIALLWLAGSLFGAQLGEQFTIVGSQLPDAIARAQQWAARIPLARSMLSNTPDIQNVAGRVLTFAFGAVGAVTNLVLVVIAAIYLALQPKLYADGVALLFPKDEGPRVSEALRASGLAMRKYLLAQFFTMAVVGILVGVGLTFVGVPSAAALGVIVGLANFVPLVGPFVGAVPGVLLAFAQGPETGLMATAVYMIAQQLEGNLLTPLVQRFAVSIPPALLLFALAGLGSLFGVLGVIVSAPLAVVLYTLVTMLWTRDALGHDVRVPGIDREA